METQTIDTTIFATSHPDIIKRVSLRELFYSVAMFVFGTVFFLGTFKLGDKSSALSMALMVLGTVSILFGVFRLFWKSKEIVYQPTGSVAKEYNLFFDLKHLSKLKEAFEEGHVDLDSDVKSESSGNVRVDVILSRDRKFVAVQLFQFVPYIYTPITSVCYFTGDKAVEISASIMKLRNR